MIVCGCKLRAKEGVLDLIVVFECTLQVSGIINQEQTVALTLAFIG